MANPCVRSEEATRSDPEKGGLALADSGLAEQAGNVKSTPQEEKEARIVRVEANFLRLPLFALDNKKMRTMDGISCEGTFRRAGQSYAFTFVATRNAGTLYPGPVARSAHLAILSLATQRGLPLRNPIVFTWRELLGRMGVSVSGRTVHEVKRALLATKGLMIESKHGLFSKTTGKPLDTTSDLNQVVGIYDELEFFGARRPDDTAADINAVWLSRWYLENLNALYSGPLDYELWRSLDLKSPIASRLYEFLFLKFYAGHQVLRFNYSNLVKFIPARHERYLSDARKQLDPPLGLLQACGVLADFRWSGSSKGEPQLHLRHGTALSGKREVASAGDDIGEEDFALDQIQNVCLAETQIVEDFHDRFGHADYRPSKAELETARELLAKYGKDQLRALIPLAVSHMKAKWPEAKSFVAVTRYMADAAKQYRCVEHRTAREQERMEHDQREREQAAEKAKRHAALKLLWGSMEEADREEIRQVVLRNQPTTIRKHPLIVERFCLEELARRQPRTTRLPAA